MNPYLPALITLVVAAGFAAIFVLGSWLIGPYRPSRAKNSPYECGMPVIQSAREKMRVRFYLTAILFILFDVEAIFLYLWARTFDGLGWLGVVEVAIFVAILVVGYVYAVKRGALDWD